MLLKSKGIKHYQPGQAEQYYEPKMVNYIVELSLIQSKLGVSLF